MKSAMRTAFERARFGAASKAAVATSVLFGATSLGFAVASCAEEAGEIDRRPTPAPLPEVPEAGTTDAETNTDCSEAGDGGCPVRPLTCAEADLCAVETGIDSRHTFLGVWGSSAKDVWAVGSGGTAAHWDGSAWKKIPLGLSDTLRAVVGRSASDVWIVSSLNVILHGIGFESGTATFEHAPLIQADDPTNFTGAMITHVWASSDGALFVGGPMKRSQPENSLWRYREGSAGETASWEAVSTFCKVRPCWDVRGLWGTTSSDVWVGGTIVHRSNGAIDPSGGVEQWSSLRATLTGEAINAIWGTSDSDVWIVGEAGTVRHWSNAPTQRWEIAEVPTKENLRAIWGTSTSDVWAIGDGGTILHFDGATWSAKTATFPAGPLPRLYGVWGSGPNDVWVVGEAIALHFTGPKTTPAPETK